MGLRHALLHPLAEGSAHSQEQVAAAATEEDHPLSRRRPGVPLRGLLSRYWYRPRLEWHLPPTRCIRVLPPACSYEERARQIDSTQRDFGAPAGTNASREQKPTRGGVGELRQETGGRSGRLRGD